MYRKTLTALVALSLSTLGLTQTFAQNQLPYLPAPAPQGHGYPQIAVRSAYAPGAMQRQAAPQKGYPYLGAPMYPCPQPNIPVQVGGTMYTNQAFAPHEMLYAHKYRSMYGPFFYRVKGAWLWTPFGIESHDKWELVGTEVKVNYKSKICPLSGFIPPR
ncbi:MAG: hypothetical protein ACYTGL_16090 [Planctomycetota bacterium]|jgi:hypothetical protein